jgi:tetratricopeptide repeat protein 8
MCKSVQIYRLALKEDATNIEAIACIGMHHFYSDQPEVALQFYRLIFYFFPNSGLFFNRVSRLCLFSAFDATHIMIK